MPAAPKLLSPDVVARLRGLELRARAIVAGVRAGRHRSAYRGYSVEFAEHRAYVPGDDLRHIDWRLFGRQDRLHIKQYEEESNLAAHLLVDASASMAYGRDGRTKLDYACELAAVLAWLILDQQDDVGLLTFDAAPRTHIPAAGGPAQMSALLAALAQTAPAATTDLRTPLHRLAVELRRRGLVVLVSDLFAPPDELLDGLAHVRHAGHELVDFHVLDEDEWRFPFDALTRFEGVEEPAHLLADPQALRRSYLAALERFTTRVRTTCLGLRADYVPVSTAVPLDVVLTGYLGGRRRPGGRR